jgi:NAD(P)-dependent dehydrogenase (short-subunit alcohol dehydrogenase family)
MKRYLITGASRGIGRAIAENLANSETRLLLHGRDRAALSETERLVEAKGGQATLFVADLSDSTGVEELLGQVGAQPLDALINNAGVTFVKPFEALTLEEWRTTFAVNVTAPFLLIQRLTKTMRSGSSIVNILSIAAKNGFAGWSSYCASKFALEGFAQAVREELRPRRIRVINLYPGATDTGIWNTVEGNWPREKMMAPGEIGAAVAYALSRPNEVAVDGITLSNTAGRL